MKPEVLSKFFTKYNNAKLPKDTIIENVLRENLMSLKIEFKVFCS